MHVVPGQVSLAVGVPGQVDPGITGRRRQVGRRRGRKGIGPAAAAPVVQAVHPLGMIDERVAIALEHEHDLVAVELAGVHRILEMPLEEHRAHAHVGHGLVVAGVAAVDQALVVGHDQVGLGGTGDAVGATLVADIHVENGTSHIALAAAPGLPGALGERAGGPVGVAGVDPRASAAAIVDIGRVLGAAGVAVAERLVAAGAVVRGVGGEEMVAVGKGVVGGAVVGKTVRPGPAVLPVIGSDPAGNLGIARVLVEVDDPAGIARVFIGQVENVPGVGGRSGVGKAGVVVDHLV